MPLLALRPAAGRIRSLLSARRPALADGLIAGGCLLAACQQFVGTFGLTWPMTAALAAVLAAAAEAARHRPRDERSAATGRARWHLALAQWTAALPWAASLVMLLIGTISAETAA